ncbi:hypothetical protein OH76DRAFT_554135 [Lentinus brumalis]|uniref:Uncharacterized protein n=1 Tax=Lentinus brumalis TaxID=2498619 RepID=A0A371D968_9APHY|nr:hypothetical protein OH76DRAFT_554135 [Polyporus brumalis]
MSEGSRNMQEGKGIEDSEDLGACMAVRSARVLGWRYVPVYDTSSVNFDFHLTCCAYGHAVAGRCLYPLLHAFSTRACSVTVFIRERSRSGCTQAFTRHTVNGILIYTQPVRGQPWLYAIEVHRTAAVHMVASTARVAGVRKGQTWRTSNHRQHALSSRRWRASREASTGLHRHGRTGLNPRLLSCGDGQGGIIQATKSTHRRRRPYAANSRCCGSLSGRARVDTWGAYLTDLAFEIFSEGIFA